MKNQVIIFFLFACFSVQAQEVFPDNGSWYRKYHSIAWGHGGEVLWDITTYNTYWVNGDTLINGDLFYRLFDGNTMATFIKPDSLKVWCGEDPGNLRLLFDYGLMPGDRFQFYGINYPYGEENLNRVVTSVDSVLMGGIFRKRIHFSPFDSYGIGPLFIEGIGDVNFGGIELDYSYVAWWANTTTLLCFSSNGTNLYGNCFTGVKYITTETRIFPNPTTGLLEADLSEFELPVTIKIFTSTGQLINTFVLNNRNQLFNISNEGLFFVAISDNNRMAMRKVVVHQK
jgi:hypothetical protein